ncbi:hypothetical protein GF406_02705 [candidate division KSB1 bacterium]|nr:hypothetical protein [candidate division KSB1 bacterium]
MASSSLWTMMWFRPRVVIRTLLENSPQYRMTFLIVFGGMAQALSNSANQNLGDWISTGQLILICLLVGPLGGLVSLYLMAWVIQQVSQRMGGKANTAELRTAIAWSWVPLVTVLPLWIPRLILFKDELFKSKTPMIDSITTLSHLYDISVFIDQAVAIWSMVLLYAAVSEANQFSIFKGVASVLISSILIALPLLIFISIFMPV